MNIKAVKGNKSPIHLGRDYTGVLLGRWLVLGESECVRRPHGRNYRTLWKCRCTCGLEKWLHKDTLVRGLSKGCLKCSAAGRHGVDNHNWRGKGIVSGVLWSSLKHNARTRNLEFKIRHEDIEAIWQSQGGQCALTGLTLDWDERASLDRIDSNVGYIARNIQWVHKDVNLMKNHFSDDYFREMCGRVVRHTRSRTS